PRRRRRRASSSSRALVASSSHGRGSPAPPASRSIVDPPRAAPTASPSSPFPDMPAATSTRPRSTVAATSTRSPPSAPWCPGAGAEGGGAASQAPPPPPPPEPPAPRPRGGGAPLVGQASPTRDTVGSLVYRQAPGADFRKLTPEPIKDLKYADSGLTPGLLFR